jgi:hypothetical protein
MNLLIGKEPASHNLCLKKLIRDKALKWTPKSFFIASPQREEKSRHKKAPAYPICFRARNIGLAITVR